MPKLQFFPHDANAGCDHKCMRLVYERGWAGYGMWWRLCEIMAGMSDQAIPYGSPVDRAILAQQLMLTPDDCDEFVSYLADVGLVIPDYLPEWVRSERMAANALQAMKRAESARKAGEASAKKRSESR